jgi:hypothetical protein
VLQDLAAVESDHGDFAGALGHIEESSDPPSWRRNRASTSC